MITAKVAVWQRTETGTGEQRRVEVKFGPDYADGRNREWAAATPQLDLSMVLRGDVADGFPVGAAFELRFVRESESTE